MEFTPRCITFHIVAMSVFGGSDFGMETAAPELEASFRMPDGGHGSVAVPLDKDEQAFLAEIVKSASKRAMALAESVATGY